jgi:hypothetical protein
MTQAPNSEFGLSPAQEALRLQIFAHVQSHFANLPRDKHYFIGLVTQPAHIIDGNLPIFERRYAFYYAPGYGVISERHRTSEGVDLPRLTSNNGFVWELVQCLRDDTTFHPVNP